MTDARRADDLFEEGLAVRREVLGADYVDASLKASSDFLMQSQRMTTELCWGYVWGRPGLSHNLRSMLTIATLTAMGHTEEIKHHVRAALDNGVTVEEISEVLIHVTAYCGIPAGRDAFKSADEGVRLHRAKAIEPSV